MENLNLTTYQWTWEKKTRKRKMCEVVIHNHKIKILCLYLPRLQPWYRETVLSWALPMWCVVVSHHVYDSFDFFSSSSSSECSYHACTDSLSFCSNRAIQSVFWTFQLLQIKTWKLAGTKRKQGVIESTHFLHFVWRISNCIQAQRVT